MFAKRSQIEVIHIGLDTDVARLLEIDFSYTDSADEYGECKPEKFSDLHSSRPHFRINVSGHSIRGLSRPSMTDRRALSLHRSLSGSL
jgi:hypothetical protein